MIGQPRHLAFDLVVADNIVSVEKLDKVAVRRRERAVASNGCARFRLTYKLHPRSTTEPLDDHRGHILRTVVDDNDLDFWPGLAKDGFEGFANVFLGVVARDQNGNERTSHLKEISSHRRLAGQYLECRCKLVRRSFRGSGQDNERGK